MKRPSIIHLNRRSLAANVNSIRTVLGTETQLGAVVKADGYGIGARAFAEQLRQSGVKWFVVFDEFQGVDILPALGDDSRLLILRSTTLHPESYEWRSLTIDPRVSWTVHDESELDRLHDRSQAVQQAISVHIEIDTGMNRGGCDPSKVRMLHEKIQNSRWLELEGVSTHFASSDSDLDFTALQQTGFIGAADELQADGLILHQLNSHGLSQPGIQGLGLARIGLGLLGYLSENAVGSSTLRDVLRPILRWESQLCQIRSVRDGESIGYDRSFTTTRNMVIGVVPVGYGDGFPARPLPGRTLRVGLKRDDESWHYAPVIGRVNMDQITVDLTDFEATAAVGDCVSVIGDEPLAPNSPGVIADCCGTIVYEMLCRLNPAITRSWD